VIDVVTDRKLAYMEKAGYFLLDKAPGRVPHLQGRFLHECAFIILIASLVLSGRLASAQTNFGTILGTVTDQTGSAVPGAAVTLTNLGAADKRTDQTDSSGSYQFVNMTPGNYSVDFETTGLDHLKRDVIPIVVQVSVRIDATLQVGDVKQTVTVDTISPHH
jgi:Carboxypeptidase regulatory-like domain